MGKLWGGNREDFELNWLGYKGTTLYGASPTSAVNSIASYQHTEPGMNKISGLIC